MPANAPWRPPRRNGTRLRAALGLLFALALPATGSLSARPADVTADDWIRVDTAHLILFSNVSRDATVEIGRQMELFRAVLARLGPNLSADSPCRRRSSCSRTSSRSRPTKLRQKGRHAGLPANLDGFLRAAPGRQLHRRQCHAESSP